MSLHKKFIRQDFLREIRAFNVRMKTGDDENEGFIFRMPETS
jgi:hypothetical protein